MYTCIGNCLSCHRPVEIRVRSVRRSLGRSFVPSVGYSFDGYRFDRSRVISNFEKMIVGKCVYPSLLTLQCPHYALPEPQTPRVYT